MPAGLRGDPEFPVRQIRSPGRRIDQKRSDFASGHRKGRSHLARYGRLTQPGNRQLGVIGDDLLSRFTVELARTAWRSWARNRASRRRSRRAADADRPERLLWVRTFQDSGRVSQCSGRLCAWARSAPGRELTPATRIRLSALGRHQPGLVRPSGRERRQARTRSATSTSGPATGASADACTGSRTVRSRS